MTDKELKSRDMEREEAVGKIEKINDPKDLHDFLDGESRKNILDAASKRILRLRGGVTCEDVLINLCKKGYKV